MRGACQKGGKGKGHGKGGDPSQKSGDGTQKSNGKAEAPMPPAPVVDPSAFLNARRPVIQVSVIR